MRIHHSLVLTLAAIAGMSILMAGCSKDKYTTKPQLTFKSVKNYTVERGGLIHITIGFTDKEGDISDTLYIQNRTAACPASDFQSPAAYPIPDFPTSSNLSGNIDIIYENGSVDTQNALYSANSCEKPDTTFFYFWIKDKANNVSDTVRTDKPLIIKN